MNLNEHKRDIVFTLRKYHSGKWVAPLVVLRKLNPAANQALQELIGDDIVEQKYIYHKGRSMPLVRYCDTSFFNKPHLTLISGDKDE